MVSSRKNFAFCHKDFKFTITLAVHLRHARIRELEISGIYQRLWSEAAAAFERGEHKIDPHLSDKANDRRRGVTLICRPSPSVREAVADYISRLAKACPGQYFYRPEELHITVLSIISGTELWEREMSRLDACRPIIGEVLGRCRPFKIHFRGVTASPDSVLIQGFPVGDDLATIRDELRAAFASHGLGDMPDRRYKATTAHMTVMRFSKPCPDLKPSLSLLQASREMDFGECEVGAIQLILGDWYGSAESVQVFQEYRLSV
jgi:2'-5' RNA ligase